MAAEAAKIELAERENPHRDPDLAQHEGKPIGCSIGSRQTSTS